MKSRDEKKRAKAAAKNASEPINTSSQLTPWAPAQDNLGLILNDGRQNYLHFRDNATPPPTRSSFGGGGSSVGGSSDLERRLAQSAADRAMGQQPLLDSASNALQGIYGGQVHPLMQRSFDAAQNFRNPQLDTLVKRQMSGSGSRASGLLEGLFSGWAGDKTMAAGNQAYGQYYQQQQPQAAPQPGGQSAPWLQQKPMARARPGAMQAAVDPGLQAAPQAQGAEAPPAPWMSKAKRAMVAERAQQRAAPTDRQGISVKHHVPSTAVEGLSAGGAPPFNPQAPPARPPAPSGNPMQLRELEMARLLSGQYQQAQNPHFDVVADGLRQDAARAAAEREAQLGHMAGGLGQFGSGVYMARAADAARIGDEELLQALGSLRYQDYSSERDRMMQGLGMQDNREQWQGAQATQADGYRTQGAIAQQGYESQERMARDSNMLNALSMLGNLEGQNQNFQMGLLGQQSQMGLAGLNMMGQLGGQASANQLSALALAPGMNETYYYGYGPAGQLAGQVRGGDQAAAAANDAAAYNAGNQQYADAMNQWEWDQNHRWQNLNNLYGLTMPLATAFGHQTGTQQQNQQAAPTSNPWVSGILGGVGGYLGAGGTFGGGGAPGPGPRSNWNFGGNV
ncbi:MAG: hypothetical protein ACRCVZ_13005 [Aestuariivirga sp.]